MNGDNWQVGEVRPVRYGMSEQEAAMALRGYLMKERERHLACVDEVERALKIKPRTSEIRKWWKEERKEEGLEDS